MAEVYFYLPDIPRDTPRKDWYKAWRKVRVMKREAAKFREMKCKLLLQRDISQQIKSDIIDELTFPPLILGPYMDRK